MNRAAVCTALTGEDAIEVQDWDVPPLSPTSIRIAVAAASVNFPDVLIVRGEYQARPDPPFVPGSECAGVVIKTGEEVVEHAIGDRVLALLGSGAFATEVTATPPFQRVHHIPDEMPFDEASAFDLTYGTGYHGLIRRASWNPAKRCWCSVQVGVADRRPFRSPRRPGPLSSQWRVGQRSARWRPNSAPMLSSTMSRPSP